MRRYVAPKPNELQIDLDGLSLRAFHKRLRCFKKLGKLRVLNVYETPSKTKGHWHITVILAESISDIERIALQAILGSDPMREMLSWARVKSKDRAPILFIEYVPNEDSEDVYSYGEKISDCDCAEVGRCVHIKELQPTDLFVAYSK